jgi:hypothetical protein
MADPFLFRGRWTLRFKDEHGRWRQKPCAARMKTEAKRLQAELSTRSAVVASDSRALCPREVSTLGELLKRWLRETSSTACLEERELGRETPAQRGPHGKAARSGADGGRQ